MTTPRQLIDAIEANQFKMVDNFLKTGINIDAPQKYTKENTPLTAAIELNNLEMVKFLVEHGANVNTNKISPLLTATYIGNRTLDIVKFLVEHGADVNVRNKDGDTPLYNAFCNSDGIEMVKFLVEHGADVNAVDNLNGETPIFNAPRWIDEAHTHMLDKFTYLIEHGADINFKNKHGETPLMIAAKRNKISISKILIEHGADINIRNKLGKTAKDIAVENNKHVIVELLEAKEKRVIE